MVSRRACIALIVAVVLPCCSTRRRASNSAASARYATVRLAITGMTWAGCVEPVRSALRAVSGVVRAEVFFEGHEALVEYDATRCGVSDLIAAVAAVKDPQMPVAFRATVKQ